MPPLVESRFWGVRRLNGTLYRRWRNCRLRRQLLNLSYQKALLVNELLIFGTVLEESRQEAQKLLAVAYQNLLHRVRLVWVCDKDLAMLDHLNACLPQKLYLEHVEPLVVDHFSVVSQQPHDDLEVIAGINVLCHDIVICPVEQNLPQQLDRLTLRDIAFRLDQH
jgi:hypothetical protein